MTAPPKETEAPPARRRWLSFGLVGQAAAVVGLIGGVAGLLFTFVPSLRPGSGEKPSAQLELASVNDRATLREYLFAEAIPLGSLSKAVLRRLGVLTTIRYTSSGLGGKELPLVVSLTSRETGDVVCEHRYPVKAKGGPPLTFRVWTPFPAHPRAQNDSYNLHVTLFPPSGKPPSLDAADHDGIPAPRAGSAAALPLDLC
jgi:hypothetical protein